MESAGSLPRVRYKECCTVPDTSTLVPSKRLVWFDSMPLALLLYVPLQACTAYLCDTTVRGQLRVQTRAYV